MAGLVAAARARELGKSPVVHEKGDRPGGSMRLSGGYAWRYREWEEFRRQCPGGDERLQRLVWERFDEAIGWLRAHGAPVVAEETGNPLTTGVRFDVEGLTDVLVRAAGDVRLDSPLEELPGVPVVLACGGFHADRELVRRYVTPEADDVVVRGNRWSSGDGLALGAEAGAGLSAGMDEFWGRAMPAPPARVDDAGFRPLGQTYARFARVVNARGEEWPGEPSWSEIEIAQWIARQPGGRAWFHVPDSALGERVRDRTVGEMIEAARAAGGPVEREDDETVVEVVAGITTTLGGLVVDERARVADGVWAAGADVGGISTGGWASGLASALVLGLAAAEDAAG
jgi:succinate dehydrogenase/fumarate reductase flavoprotein subunit